MPPLSPSITNFGDESHDTGESGLTIDGAGFGPFAGEVWMYANSDRTGTSDQLTQTGWNDMQITGAAIPGSPNNSPGTVYLFVQRSDLAWSFPYQFTLTSPTGQSITAATETDSGIALSGTLHAVLAAATETDSAVVLQATVHQAISFTPATEADSSVALTGAQSHATTAATETDSAVALTSSQSRAAVAATETDNAVALVQGSTTQSMSITAATEADAAIGLISPQITPLLDNSDPAITGGGRVMGEGQFPEWWKNWEEPQPIEPPPSPRPLAELLAEAAGSLDMPAMRQSEPDPTSKAYRLSATIHRTVRLSASVVRHKGEVGIEDLIRYQRRHSLAIALISLLDK